MTANRLRPFLRVKLARDATRRATVDALPDVRASTGAARPPMPRLRDACSTIPGDLDVDHNTAPIQWCGTRSHLEPYPATVGCATGCNRNTFRLSGLHNENKNERIRAMTDTPTQAAQTPEAPDDLAPRSELPAAQGGTGEGTRHAGSVDEDGASGVSSGPSTSKPGDLPIDQQNVTIRYNPQN